MDALIYGLSLGFAVFLATQTSFVTHRLWASVAAMGYGLGCMASLVLAGLSRHLATAILIRVRTAVLYTVLIGAVVIPLILAVFLRAERGGAFTHDEVITTERAGVSLLHGDSPYDHSSSPADAEPRRFPYLPLTAVFGIPRALLPAAVGDARVWFALTAIGLTGAALTTWAPSSEVRIRALQVGFAVPVAAMGAVAGGDDVVALAMLMLALALAHRGKLTGAAITSSCAGLLKATAWPLWIVLAAGLWAHRLPGPHRSLGPALGLTLLPMGLAAALVWDGPGLVTDTALFPLGLADRVASRQPADWQPIRPADSWLSMLGGGLLRLTIAAALLLGAAALAGRRGKSFRPAIAELRVATVSTVALMAGLISAAVLLVVGSVVRPGLIQYPLALLTWGTLLRGEAMGQPEGKRKGGGRGHVT